MSDKSPVKRDWWLTFYRPLSGPAVECDFVRAEPGKGLPVDEPLGCEWVLTHVAVLGKTLEEMVLIKQGARIALGVQR